MAETTRDRIYRLLEQSKLRKKNVRELSRVSGVRAGTLYNVMSKNARLCRVNAEKVAAALGVGVEELEPYPVDYVRSITPSEEARQKQQAAAELARLKRNDGALCWSCRRAVPDEKTEGCEWTSSKGNTPVPGWTATPSENRRGGWQVRECPKFLPDGAKG